jgi:hypothetical protein
LKDVLANLIPAEQKRIAAFRKEHGSFKIGDVTVDMVCTDAFDIILTFYI